MARAVFPGLTRSGPWTPAEIRELRRYHGGAPVEDVARILGRSVEDLRRKIEELRQVQHAGRWTQAEAAEFKRLYGTRTDEDLALIFEHSLDAVKRLAARLCLAKDKAFVRKLSGPASSRMPRWEKLEIERLVTLYPVAPNLEIAQKLGRSVKSIVSKAHNLGLKKEADRLREMGRQNVSLRYRKAAVAEEQ